MKNGWQTVRLDKLTEAESPITYGVVKPGDPGDVLFIRGGDLANGRVLSSQLRTITRAVSEQYSRTLLRGGELLMSLVGQPGQVAVAPLSLAGANIARQVGLIRLRSEIATEFICYFLQSPDGLASLGTHTGGSVQQVINLGDLRTVNVPVPPLAEQQRIVGILDEAFAGLATATANAEKNLQNARALFESHLQSVFTQRGAGWRQKTLEEIATTFGRGKSRHRPRNEPKLYGGKYPFVQTGDIRNAAHFITEYSQTYSEAGLAQSKLWPKGTICMALRGI
jgi:type I restriction enzyme S subunit